MNWGAQVHLAMNHVPIVGIAFVVFTLAVGAALKNQSILKLGLWTGILVALAAIPVSLTGESVEELVERLPGVTDSVIERHEGAAKLASILFYVMGGLSVIALLGFRSRIVTRPVAVALLVVAMVTAGQAAWTGHLGGLVRHTELRGDATSARAADAGEHGEAGESVETGED